MFSAGAKKEESGAEKRKIMKKRVTASVLAASTVLSMSTGMVFADETKVQVPEIEMADASEVEGTKWCGSKYSERVEESL